MQAKDGLLKFLDESVARYQVLSHVPAYSAHDVARAAHVPERSLAKTLLVKADSQYWLVVLRADQRVDEKALRHELTTRHVHLAQEKEIESMFPDCETGAMPPFGNLYGLPVIVEKGLSEDDEIVFNAGTHTDSVKMRFADFVSIVDPIIAQFAREPNDWKDESHR